MKNQGKARWIVVWTGGLACAVAGPVGVIGAVNWYAEYQADSFCTELKEGAGMPEALSLAATKGLHHHYSVEGQRYRFVFPGFSMDKAYCEIALDASGRVLNAKSYFLSD